MAPAEEYAETLLKQGFDFMDFSERYPNLAKSEYGRDLRHELKKLALNTIKAGDIVEFLPAFQDAGDESFTFIVKDTANYPRISMIAIEQSGMPFQPIYTATIDMIKLKEKE